MQYRLLYNAAAHFAAAEKYPEGLLAEMCKPGEEGLEALCWALSALSAQAELARRAQGYDKGEFQSPEDIRALLMPKDLIPARKAVLEAVSRGLGDGGEDEVDEVLLELQKKKAPGCPKQSI